MISFTGNRGPLSSISRLLTISYNKFSTFFNIK
jgi:hypothetical protein